MTEADVTGHQQSLDEKKNQQENLAQKYSAADYDKRIADLKAERNNLKQSQRQHYDTIRQLNEETSRRSELKLKRDEKERKEKSIQEM